MYSLLNLNEPLAFFKNRSRSWRFFVQMFDRKGRADD